ncbi:uncharacterized protein LOC130913494 isoform X2 [Corythoichthys intestinalis]|uniref:uncharacterized protein LOC130913494 isoform X2 n=1 Tax=Corythoichthys intestinalis TaxID=161448 RepID=UPI0025A5898E|nr:uncharacterized protein LOC130913494 isoform X2 [Corythoichthys intestinalis]
MLKDLIKERLDAAAEEIFGLFERTIKSYEEQLYRVREESERHRQQLEAICKAQIVIRVGDVQQSIGHQENLPTQLLWGNSSLEQENPQPLTVKEEKDGQQLPHVKEEEEKADVSELSLPGVSKDSENNEDKLTNLLQLHHHHHDSSRGDLHGGLPPDNLQAPLTDSDCMEEPLGKDADCEGLGIKHRASMGSGTNTAMLPEPFQFLNFDSKFRCPDRRSEKNSCQTQRRSHMKRVSVHCNLNSTMDTVRRRSKVWLNFTKKNDQSAQCNICNTAISCKGGCTTNMIKHLRLHGIKVPSSG